MLEIFKFIQLQREVAIIFSIVLQQNSPQGEKVCIILTGNLKDIFVVRLSNSYENNAIICAHYRET